MRQGHGKKCAPSTTRTCDTRFRKPVLYPAELWGRHEVEFDRSESVEKPTASLRLYSAAPQNYGVAEGTRTPNVWNHNPVL